MTPTRPTEELVHSLSRRLEPVRPVPALGRQGLGVAAVFAATGVVAAAWLGLHPLGVLSRSATSACLTLVLAVLAVSGLTAGLASRIPGRERTAWAAAGAGVAALAALALIALAQPGPVAGAAPLRGDLRCIARSLLFAVPAGTLAELLARRGAPWRQGGAGVALALGAIGAGALLVHLSCPSPSPWHWLLAHALVPLGAGLPVGVLLGRLLPRLPASRP
jgi:hypothetical protein